MFFTMISIICVYNNVSSLDEFLLSSLKNQSIDYELILLDNTKKKFSNAAEALNYGGKKAKGDYLMFVHQDIDLLVDDWLENAENILNSLKNLGIAGVAGFPEVKKNPVILSYIMDGNPPQTIGINITQSENVQTVDECLFFVPKSIFNKIQFDVETCPDWHLYAVDYCLSLLKLNLSVYVIPCALHHVSRSDSFSNQYYSTLNKITKKHGTYFNKIYTTCGVWHTNRFRLLLNVFEDKIRRKISS